MLVMWDNCADLADAGTGRACLLLAPLRITQAGYERYALPLRKPLTTGAGGGAREGFLIRIQAEAAEGAVFAGIGEVAPLPGARVAADRPQ
jgi:hypothetical protein